MRFLLKYLQEDCKLRYHVPLIYTEGRKQTNLLSVPLIYQRLFGRPAHRIVTMSARLSQLPDRNTKETQ
jgi:hypothetical protein